MSILDKINSPQDLRELSSLELDTLSSEIRDFLVRNVSKTGGHLGPNLGVVELTLAIHRTFDSPRDPILWDTGHQTYVHKIVTGRAASFETLRQDGGLSGYPSRQESVHDVIENSHASTALSYADGIAKAFELNGESDRHVVAVVGDGALTGGMTWEAINNIADSNNRSLVIIVNDNERSYSPTIGGLANQLATLRTTRAYEEFLGWGKSVLAKTPLIGPTMYDALHGLKKGFKDMVAPQGLFEDLGLKYIGPVDGHNIADLEFALSRARDFGGPVIVHAITEKGRGYGPAETDEADRFHAVGIVDPDTGKPVNVTGTSWTSVFSGALVELSDKREDIVAITAAMLGPTGLESFKAKFPMRTFDVGIAEQHAITSAVGMAHAGLHPVVAIYSTFLNRAIDQVIMDAALHKAGITVVLDRAGVTGDDGASHNGMWDLALLQIVPGIEVFAPRDSQALRDALAYSVSVCDHPTVIRFPKGAVPIDIPKLKSVGNSEIIFDSGATRIAIVSVGAMAASAIEAAQELSKQAIAVQVIDLVKVSSFDEVLIDHLASFDLVVSIEDGIVTGGVGQNLAHQVVAANNSINFVTLGVAKEFLRHATRKTLLAEMGLDSAGIAESVKKAIHTSVI